MFLFLNFFLSFVPLSEIWKLASTHLLYTIPYYNTKQHVQKYAIPISLQRYKV